MANFGAPEKVMSEFLTSSLIRWKLRQNQDHCYLFRQRKPMAQVGDVWKSYWICLSCDKIRKAGTRGPVCNLHVLHDGGNETILTNPEYGHHPECQPKNVAESEALQLKRAASKEVQRGKKRPLQAYSEAAEEITKRYRGIEQVLVEEAFPTYEHVKRSLYRRAEQSLVAVEDPHYIPVEYQRTTRGRYADQADPFWNERWLLYCSPPGSPPALIFASDLDLQVLNENHTWIMDGTFKIAPAPDFKQVYTIHGYGRFESEAVPCVTALLSGKTEEQYTIVLRQIRQALFQHHENVGAVQRILVDFEIASHNAIQNTFHNVEIIGCNFHFGKALVARMHSEGLKEKYLRKVQNQPEHPVKTWFGCVKALALLPAQLVPFAWNLLEHDLQHVLPPMLINPQDRVSLQNFATYFQNTWINGNQIPISRWNHWSNHDPRTTNHAEGYHSGLNRNALPEIHMALRNFLHVIQREHNRVQQRIRKLYANTETPKQGHPLYQQLHQQINNEKGLFF